MSERANPGRDSTSANPKRDNSVRRYHSVYRPADLTRAIQQIKGSSASMQLVEGPDDNNGWSVEADPATLTSEDTNRLRALERIAADPCGHRRRSLVGSHAMVRRLDALCADLPHFAPAIDLVSRAVLVSARTATPVRLPPILLLGEPGIGKSYTLRRLAETIGADFSLIAANITDTFRLRGLNTAWRGARTGLIADVLLGSSSAPIVLVDEFDKAIGSGHERPYDVWHSLLERENAAAFKDDFLEIELRADSITWFASANDASMLPDSILDRLVILEIPMPSREQLRTIVASIYRACRETYGTMLPEHLRDDVLDALARHNPRHIGRLLDLAIGYAAASGRCRLSVDDIRRADRLAGEARSERNGFRRRVGSRENGCLDEPMRDSAREGRMVQQDQGARRLERVAMCRWDKRLRVCVEGIRAATPLTEFLRAARLKSKIVFVKAVLAVGARPPVKERLEGGQSLSGNLPRHPEESNR